MQNEIDDSSKVTVTGGPSNGAAPPPPLLKDSDHDAVLGGFGGRSYHNFQGDKVAIFRQVSKATGPLCKNFNDLQGATIALDHFYSHTVEMENQETGEVSPATRVVLIDKSGDCFAFVSATIAQDLSRIIQAFGEGPWGGELVVKIVQGRTRKGRNMYQIVPV